MSKVVHGRSRTNARGGKAGALCNWKIRKPLAATAKEITCKSCLQWPELVATAYTEPLPFQPLIKKTPASEKAKAEGAKLRMKITATAATVRHRKMVARESAQLALEGHMAPAPKERGRPGIGPDGAKLTEALLVRMSTGEHARIKELADKHGFSAGGWVRRRSTRCDCPRCTLAAAVPTALICNGGCAGWGRLDKPGGVGTFEGPIVCTACNGTGARTEELAPIPRYETRGVLAGAYKVKDPAQFLTHLVDLLDASGGEDALCKRVKPGHMADGNACSLAASKARPTCEPCGKRWDKVHAKGAVKK